MRLAPTGAEYPFSYAPASASDSLLNAGSPLASLLAKPTTLFGFTLNAFNADQLADGVLSWGSTGSGLTDGNYSDVPLIGLTLPGSLPALASFTVTNGSVDPSSLVVSVSDGDGQYLGLPSPSNGFYSFGLDVFAALPGNPAPPAADGLSSVLAAMPLINLPAANVNSGSPLQVTALQRIQQQLPLSDLTQVGPYPLADGSAPAANDNSIYTYSGVPVQLLTDASDAVALLNPDATATVKLSGGSIIAVTLDQDLYFSGQSSSAYTLEINLASKFPGSSITNPTALVTSQNLSLNDFSEQDSFSANSGRSGAGVFLASGLSDQLGLLPSFGAYPLQNRVSYVDGETIVYLNNTAGASGSWKAVSPSNVSIKDLYTNPDQYQFTTASSPTAITDQASNNTYVFWVEAANPVIPLTGSNGEQNYQQFLDAYWDNQRINYSYATTSEAGSNTTWHYVNEGALYAPAGSIITNLRSFSVELDGKTRSLLVWTEVPITALKQALSQPEQVVTSQLAVIKTGLINSDPGAIAGGYLWEQLFTDAAGQSTIREIPWSEAHGSGLTISDLSAADLTVEINNQATLTPVLSWSQGVRTPYNQAVLDSQPTLFVPFAALQTGYNTLNLGAAGDFNTQTFASSTGLSTAVQGPLTKSTATAVRNDEGLGVLATGLGSSNSALLDLARNASLPYVEPVVAVFEGAITGDTLTVSEFLAGTLKVGDLVLGDGVTANSKITEVVDLTAGTFLLDRSSTVATATSMRTVPGETNVPLSTFSGSFSGSGGDAGYTTLSLTGLSGSIQIGDRVLGLGLAGGVTVQQVITLDQEAGTATLIVDQGPTSSGGSYGLAGIPGGTSSPYTIEFWTQLGKDSNPAGAGLVGLGQASSTALPDRPVELPDGWLLSSAFAVERLTWRDALNQSLVSELPSDESATDLYGWRWGLVATGTNTTAMDGTGGSNISRNALVLANLSAGDTIAGVNTFLDNYGLSASDLIGFDGTPADQIASTPTTNFNFITDQVYNEAAGTEVATTSLNGVAVLTESALMNGGFISAADVDTNSNLSTMLQTLWAFQQNTGEAKVNFDLNPEDQITTDPPALPPVGELENYGGYALNFALLPGPAVSVNSNGQIAYDVSDGVTLFSDASIDYRDDQWHYVAVSFLPNYVNFIAIDTIFQAASNVGTANLYIDGKLVASQDNVVDPFGPINLNDNAQLLAENAGGAIDLLAIYDKALTTLQMPAAADGWPMPTSTDALELMQEVGYVFEGLTPHRGELPGAINNHYLAHTVDPNDAVDATFTSVLLPDQSGGYSWSEATTLNPQLSISPTDTSASNQNLADALLIPINAGDWKKAGWFVDDSSNAVPFNPANRELATIAVTLTPVNPTGTAVITRTLTPDEVLLGSVSSGSLASLQTIQPFSSNSTQSLAYRFLSSEPALNLKISEAANSAGDSGAINPTSRYTAQVTLSFADGTVVSNVSANNQTQGLALGFNPSVVSTLASTVQNSNSALATAQVLEQAPLQLKYVDSGVQFSSESSPANPSPAPTFGSSQVYGTFADPVNNGLKAGWIAIAQPRSTNASSDPAGRIWIQYAGSFAFDANNQPEEVASGLAASTWLDALATSTFSPDQPNLPLLNNAFNPSPVGGLLIKADPTDGWGQNLGSNILVADVNNDGVEDLVLSAPQANGGGAVMIINGTWIQNNLTQATGETILDLSNPDNFADAVTILKPGVADEATDLTTVAGFGSALAFVSGTSGEAGQLLVGAPNYLRTLDAENELQSTQPVGALYAYQYNSAAQPGDQPWGSGVATDLDVLAVGTGGTLTITQAGNSSTTSYWGSQLGSSLAVSSDGRIAVSSPGVMGAMIYTGTEVATERVDNFKINASSTVPQGLLSQVQIGSAINTTKGLNNPDLQDVRSLKEENLTDNQINFLNRLREFQNNNVADATTLNNQAIQYGAFGTVSLFASIAGLKTALNGNLSSGTAAELTAEDVFNAGGITIYGPNLYNTLGDSGFGSDLAFVDLTNSPNGQQLIVGAEQSGGGGMVYHLDPDLLNSDQSLGAEQYLAFDAVINLFTAAEFADRLGSGLINLGDVNQDGYEDVLFQAYNASSSAGNAYLLFGSDQLSPFVTGQLSNGKKGLASLGSGSLGTINFEDGTSSAISILSELGGAGSLAGQGVYGAGDYNADGYPDLPLGSGTLGKSYITYGHAYLEAISNLQLNRLTSNNGFMLDGLATTTQGSLRSLGDFNGDGYGDFISINPGPVATTVRIELGANTQEILAEAPYNYYTFTVSADTQVLPAGDLNGDGLDDLALFINTNLASEGNGNFGAGSTTGILYGRSSEALPVGSGFGFLAPVSIENEPLMPLPAIDVAGGLTDVAPAFIAAGDTIFAAVKGNGAGDTSIWFTQSQDSGSTWDSWVDLSSAVSGLSTSTTPSLALFNNTLYLAVTTPQGELALSSWDPASSDLTNWSQPLLFGDATTSFAPQLIDRGDSLGVIWVEDGVLKASSSTEPGSASTEWAQPVSLNTVTASGTTPIASSSEASFTWLGITPVLAVNNAGIIEVYSQIGSAGLQLVSTFEPAAGESTIISAPVITATDTGLALTYTNSDNSVSLARLNLLTDSGAPLPGVLIDVNGAISLNTNDLTWTTTRLDATNSGISSTLATTPLSVNGNLLLANIRSNSQPEDQIWLDIVPNLADSQSNPWINSSIQLPDGNGGWLISQSDLGNPNSTLTALGDINGDGFDDLAVANSSLKIAGAQPVFGSTEWSTLRTASSITGSSPSTPAVIKYGDTIYMAVQGSSGSDGDNIYWTSSSDGGNYWSDWQALPSDITTNAAPSLAIFKDTLYLSYLGHDNNYLNITSLSDESTNTWSTQYQIPWSGGTQSALSASLLTETIDGDQYLTVYYVSNNESQSYLLRTSTNDPSSSSGWSEQIFIDYDDATAYQTASGPLAVSFSDGQTTIAYQGGTHSDPSPWIYLTSSTNQEASDAWSLQALLNPNQRTSLDLLDSGNGLTLSYTDSSNSTDLQLQPLVWSSSDSQWTLSQDSESASIKGISSTTTGLLPLRSDNGDFILLYGINGSGNNSIELATAGISGQNSGARLISGAPNGSDFEALNDALAPKQLVQISAPSPTVEAGLFVTAERASDDSLRLVSRSEKTGEIYYVHSDSLDTRSFLSDSLESASQLFSSASGGLASWSNIAGNEFTADSYLNTVSDFGDLNGDGKLDWFDPYGNNNIYSIENLHFNLWSIRAAGDVNGNGVDDVILALVPQGPAYVPDDKGEPTALMSVLVDGSLFEVDTTNNTFSLDRLQRPLDPYNRSELYDINSTSISQYEPSLQNWFDPILSFEPGEITAASPYNTTATASARSYSPPAAVVSENGDTYLFYSGADRDGTDNASGLWMAYQSADDSTWQQITIPAGASCNNTSPSAAYFEGKLYVAFTDTNQDIHIAVAENPTDASSWSSYQVVTTTNESTAFSPTLLAEDGRLALFFPTNNPISWYDTLRDSYQYVRYLYSLDPSDDAAWGQSIDTTTGKYSGVSGQLDYEVTSSIAATRFNGYTVLGFRSTDYGVGGTGHGNIMLLTSSDTSPTEWNDYNTTISESNGVGLTTDQSFLYLTTAPNYGKVNPSAAIYSVSSDDISTGQWSVDPVVTINGVTLTNNNLSYNRWYADTDYNDATVTPFMSNGQLMAAWADSNSDIQVASLQTTVSDPTQSSLAGYSLDGNIDINGDGFMDILLSDPSDPSKSVNNQYALFGGDYLNIANQVGTEGNDRLVGTPLSDVIYSLSGSDIVLSNGGHDVILTGAGDDVVSIVDAAFLRIDTGEGFDQIILEGNANQAYNFSSANGEPEYYVGTKLRNVELISSSDYGANILSFDPASVSSFNKDRVLFVTPDDSDSLYLYSDSSYEFARSTSYDTSFAGVVWNAYASQSIDDKAIVDPTLLYVLNPAANDNTWLDNHVLINPSTPAPSSSTATLLAPDAIYLPKTPAVASQKSFGKGLVLTAFMNGPSSGVASFEVSRSDTSFRQVVSYSSSSENSTADAGLDYYAIAGQLVLDEGESSQLISVPINQERVEKMRGAYISLQVEEVPDLGHEDLHLVISSQTGPETSGDLISGFLLDPISDSQVSRLKFRTDTEPQADPDATSKVQSLSSPEDNTGAASGSFKLADNNAEVAAEQSATTSSTVTQSKLTSSLRGADGDAAEITVYRRSTADTSIYDASTLSQTIRIDDAIADRANRSFDRDRIANQQVGIELQLNTSPGSNLVSLVRNNGRLAPLTALGRVPSPPSPDPSPSPSPAPIPRPRPEPSPTPMSRPQSRPSQEPNVQPEPQPSPTVEQEGTPPEQPVEPESPINTDGSVNYEIINSGMADFSGITQGQYDKINWAEVDFTIIAQSPGSADSLNYGWINYSEIDSAEDFAALARIIQNDELTGFNIRDIGANPYSQDSFDVVIGQRGEKQHAQGSELNELFQVRGGGKLVASGGGGSNLYYSNSKNAHMIVNDFTSEDVAKLDRFDDRAVRNGKLQLFQDGKDAVISFKGTNVLTLRNIDANQLIFSQGCITLAPDPLA